MILVLTLEEFAKTLYEDEYVVGDRVWLEGVRFRVAFEVTNVVEIPARRHSERRRQKRKSPRRRKSTKSKRVRRQVKRQKGKQSNVKRLEFRKASREIVKVTAIEEYGSRERKGTLKWREKH